MSNKAAVRVNSLNLPALAAQERHGKRSDAIGAARRVREAEPLVWGTQDLCRAFEQHTRGWRVHKACRKPVLHVLLQFPTALEITPENEQHMFKLGREFVAQVYGQDAAFAGRLDRDEKGRHVVDYFVSPSKLKITKGRGADAGTETSTRWLTTGHHGKLLCRKHEAEIRRRHGGEFRDTPRAVGMALQSEWAGFLRERGFEIDAKREKTTRQPDRLSPEGYAEDRRRALVETAGRIEAEHTARLDALDAATRELERIEEQAQAAVGLLARMIASAHQIYEQFKRDYQAKERRWKMMRSDAVLSDEIWRIKAAEDARQRHAAQKPHHALPEHPAQPERPQRKRHTR